MYTSDLTQIRQGLVNYIGAIIKSSGFEGKAANQVAASILLEETLKLSQTDESGVFDLYILKPLFRANIAVLKQRIQELSSLNTRDSKVICRQYNDVINIYENILNKL